MKNRSLALLMSTLVVMAWTSLLGSTQSYAQNIGGAESPAEADTTAVDLMLILDASGSMWGKLGDDYKIAAARTAVKKLASGLDEKSQVGLIAYGHREKGDCADIETLIPIGSVDVAAVGAAVDGLNPTGMTPITASIQHAFDLIRNRSSATTVVVVTDGLETCGGDPCQLVKEARDSGLRFALHVIGFGVTEEDVSQLQCVAQAGGGQYFDAQTADQLASAFESAVDIPADGPVGYFSLKATAEGGLIDVAVHATDAETGAEAASSRTYVDPATNPTFVPLAEGTYDMTVIAVGLDGARRRTFTGVHVAVGDTVHREVDFSAGELGVLVTRNGVRSDASIRVYVSGTSTQVASGRTYVGETTNPKIVRLTAGEYDVRIRSVEIDGGVDTLLTDVAVVGGQRTNREYNFRSGTLVVRTTRNGELVDSVVRVREASTGTSVDQRRTYASTDTNPARFVVPPGEYVVVSSPVRPRGLEDRSRTATVVIGKEAEIEIRHDE